MTISEFEQRVFDQKPVQSGHYDSEYFTGDWRAEGNNYNLETRRAIEARNPFLIKEVFQPKKVLDLGCGPGALMHLLWELGVDVEGIDFAESSRDLATPEVRDRITVGDVADPTLKPAAGYDLVICREVLEHLTVLQVKQAVAAMVRLTSRFIYVTTRFHPDPEGLLDFTTQFDVDPSHITLLNKDMLRLMFILDGCRSRPDLEERMDWGRKGRVLVLEKINQPAAGSRLLAVNTVRAE
jgi:SAM-dependent methyltransferase